jgi:hypothetical protein
MVVSEVGIFSEICTITVDNIPDSFKAGTSNWPFVDIQTIRFSMEPK